MVIVGCVIYLNKAPVTKNPLLTLAGVQVQCSTFHMDVPDCTGCLRNGSVQVHVHGMLQISSLHNNYDYQILIYSFVLVQQA